MCRGKAELIGFRTDGGLGHLPHGEEHVIERRREEAIKEVRLVLPWVRASCKPLRAIRVHHDTSVVAGRQSVRTLGSRPREQMGELEPVIADDTGVRGEAARIRPGEGLDHLTLEDVAHIHGVVRNSESVAHATCRADGVITATLAFALALRQQLHGDADHIMACLGEECSGYRGVDAPAHRYEHSH